MVATPVDAIWAWFVGDSAFKAVYGRFTDDPSDSSWTKDYLQVSGGCRELLTAKFPQNPGSDRVDVKYFWPGSEVDGFIKFSADRHHLSWSTTSGAPAPWRLTVNPTPIGPQTLPGNPDATTTAEANKAFDEFKSRGIDGYLVAVKLRGEEGALHLRTYISQPPAGLEFAALESLPLVIQQIAGRATAGRACSSAELAGEGNALSPEVAAILEMLEDNPNVLLTGPPGTGKSVLLNKVAQYIENPGSSVLFDPDQNHDAFSVTSDAILPGKSRTVVFHPSYSYENLVLGLMPIPAAHGVDVRVATGPLINLAHYASGGGNRALLILDEFNRGNAAAILGDTLALLDRDKRGDASVDLAYGELEIRVPEEFAAAGETLVKPRFSLPSNLWVLAAMNSSDRSVAPLDAALRRRFSIVEIQPDYDVLASRLAAADVPKFDASFETWGPGDVARLAVELLTTLNLRISAVLGSDFQLGQSNLWHVSGDSAIEVLASLTSAWDKRVVQTLRMSLQDNDAALAAIVRADPIAQASNGQLAKVAFWEDPLADLGSYGQARLRFASLSEMDPTESLAALKYLAGV